MTSRLLVTTNLFYQLSRKIIINMSGRNRGRGQMNYKGQAERLRNKLRQYQKPDEGAQDAGNSNRPPPGLVGKEIGMWYRNRTMQRRQTEGPRLVSRLSKHNELLGIISFSSFKVQTSRYPQKNSSKFKESSKTKKIQPRLQLQTTSDMTLRTF